MPKPNPLMQGLEKRSTPAQSKAPVVAAETPSKAVTPSRAGKVLVGGHFAPEVQTSLKIIAAEERTTVQALLAEGINTVFAKRHKPQIAEVSTS
jgi:hypothetical protein